MTTPPTDPRDAFFAVDFDAAAIGRRTGRASRLILIMAVGKFLLHLVSLFIISRLVPPEEFGVAALAMPIILIVTQLSQFGLVEPIVQSRALSHRLVSSLFWFNFLFGAGFALIVVLLAGPAAQLYGDPRVAPVFRVLALSVFLSAISTPYIAILRRRMQFKLLELALFAAFALSILVAVIAAWAGASYWAVVIQHALQPAITIAILAPLCGWAPSPPWLAKLGEAKRLLKFGGHVALAGVVARIGQSVPTIVAGRFLGIEAAGLYYRSFTIAQLVPQRAIAPLASVFVASLSRLQDQPEDYRRMVERMLPRMSVLLMPVGVLLATLPDVMVRYTLGPNWVETAPLIAWMSVVIIQAPVFSVGNWILISVGASRAMLNFAVFGLVATTAAALIGVRYGIETMTAAYMLSSLFLRMPSLLVLAHRHSGLPYGGLLRACGIDLALVLGTIAAMLGLRAALAGYGDLIQAAAVCLAIALIYGARILLDPVLRLDAWGMLYKIASRLSRRRPV